MPQGPGHPWAVGALASIVSPEGGGQRARG